MQSDNPTEAEIEKILKAFERDLEETLKQEGYLTADGKWTEKAKIQPKPDSPGPKYAAEERERAATGALHGAKCAGEERSGHASSSF